jgi:geranylgeranyl pyrophosphate synthase
VGGDSADDNCKSLSELLEGVHSGSLIVDDIQDGSVIRRDRPTFHIQHGVSKALNAGNWLYFWSLKKINDLSLTAEIKSKIMERFHDTLFEGHIGQALDIGKPVTEIPRKEIAHLCASTMALKTGSLVSLGLTTGALLGGASDDEVEALSVVGNELGMILQIYDDLKNLKLGSEVQVDFLTDKRLEDLKNLRPGYAWAYASENEELFAGLCKAVQGLPKTAELKDWIQSSQIHQVSTARLDRRETELKLETNKLVERFGRSKNLWNLIEPLIRKLEEAYERN